MAQTIAVIDFGSQYTQVIARRIRECEVYSKIYHFSTTAEELKADGVTGVILSGGPSRSSRWACPFWGFATVFSSWARC